VTCAGHTQTPRPEFMKKMQAKQLQIEITIHQKERKRSLIVEHLLAEISMHESEYLHEHVVQRLGLAVHVELLYAHRHF